MTDINLLPWRKNQEEQAKKELISLILMSVLAAVLVIIIINNYMQNLNNIKFKHNQRIEHEIDQFENEKEQLSAIKKQITYYKLHMSSLKKLQGNRLVMARLFHELSTITPKEISLDEIKRRGNQIDIQGSYLANQNISLLMHTIRKKSWLTKPALRQVKKNKFQLNFQLEAANVIA